MKLADRYRHLEDPLRAERRAELVLIVVVLLLVLQFFWGGFRMIFPALPDPVKPRSNSLTVTPLETGVQIDPELRAQIATRPLFWSGRRPLADEPNAESVAAAEPTAVDAKQKQPGKIDGVKLTGVFGSGESAGIIVLSKGKKRRVMVGEDIDGWELQSVDPSEAVFASSGREARLQLKQGTIVASQAQIPEPVKNTGKGEKSKADTKSSRTAGQEEGSDTLKLGRSAPTKKT